MLIAREEPSLIKHLMTPRCHAVWVLRAKRALLGLLLALPSWAPAQSTEAPRSPPLLLTSSEEAWLRAHPTVTLALDEFNPPLNFRRADAQGPSFAGASIDYAQLVARKAGFTLKLEGSTWVVALDKAMNHRVDGVLSAGVREERKQKLNFTEPYLEVPIAMVTRSSHPEVRGLAQFSGERVAVGRDTVRVPVLRQQCPACVLVEVSSPGEGVAAVASGQTDAFFDDLPVVQLAATGPGSTLRVALLYYYSEAGTLRVALRNTAPELLSIFNKSIAGITADEHEAIRRRWLQGGEGASVQRELPLTESQRAWLAEHRVIRVAVDPKRAPIESLDENGKPQGISIEFLNRVEELLGVRFEIQKGSDWAALVDKARRREIDVFSSLLRNTSAFVVIGP